MEIKDLIITPIYFVLLSFCVYWIRPYVTTKDTRKYFLPALWVRFFGALSLGFIYQFHYNGGDTYNFFDQASIINEAFLKDPSIGLKLMFYDENYSGVVFEYAQRIRWWDSPPEMFLIRIIAFLSLLTFNTYSAIALFFAMFSFLGSWCMFTVINKKFGHISKWIPYGILFIPSSIFWGSGILKDTITMGALGVFLWAFDKVMPGRPKPLVIGIIFMSCWVIFSLKIYILICLIFSALLWLYLQNINRIRNSLLRIGLIPLLFTVSVAGSFWVVNEVTRTSEKYRLDSIAERAQITSYDIRFWTGRDAGSGYSLGDQDGTWGTLISLTPAAINVSLFRPYLWEVKNPLMALASLESLAISILTILALIRMKRSTFKSPMLVFFLVFSLMFAFAVGVSTYNFGTLSRYKMPLTPFYVSFLLIAGGRKEVE